MRSFEENWDSFWNASGERIQGRQEAGKICFCKDYGRTSLLQDDEGKFFNKIGGFPDNFRYLDPVRGDPVFDRLALGGLKLLWQGCGIDPEGLKGEECLLLGEVVGQL